MSQNMENQFHIHQSQQARQGATGPIKGSTNGFFLRKLTIRLDFDKPICYPALPIARLRPRDRYFFASGAAVAAGINQTKGT